MNLSLRRIRRSKSETGTLILFVLKRDGKLQLYVDYRGLNAITVKNYYTLPLITELLDRFAGVAVFTKLDLVEVYYRIRIKRGDK